MLVIVSVVKKVSLLFGSYLFFFKQKTAYEMRISDWSSDVCSSDLLFRRIRDGYRPVQHDVGFLVCKADVEEIIAVIGGRGIEGQVCAAEAVLIRGRQRAGEVLRQWYAKSISTGSSQIGRAHV